MKTITILLFALLFLAGFTNLTYASIYANDVEATTSHHWDNGANTPAHPEYVLGQEDDLLTGWMTGGGYIEVSFQCDLTNGNGPDLTLFSFGPGTATASIRSTDEDGWALLGTIIDGGPGQTTETTWDFGDIETLRAGHKVVRIDKSAGTPGKFFDAVRGEYPFADPAEIAVTFTLLTWDDDQATPELPSAVEVKPANPGVANDRLMFTDDDGFYDNPVGGLSHNFVDINGLGGSPFNVSASLTGSLTMVFSPTDLGSTSDVNLTALHYVGRPSAGPMEMNQFLVTEDDWVATNPTYNTDGVGNCGTWHSYAANNWSIEYTADFFFDAGADGNPPAGDDVDSAYNNKTCTGYLIPVGELTSIGMMDVALDDPAGFYEGDFEQYLLDEIVPRLPAEATYLLITQMSPTHPDYAELGMPITTNSLVGNTTFAYATQGIPEPRMLPLVSAGAWLMNVLRRRRV